MSRTLYLIRALHFDPVARNLAEALSAASGAPVVFVCDESRGPTDVGPYEKVSLTPGRLRTLGLENAPEDWGWFWGDLCYYAALARYADYEYYALIESDVFLSPGAAQEFVAALQTREEQALAVRLGVHKAPPKYSKPLRRLGLDNHWGCIFPVSRVHRDVVRAMLKLRKRACLEMPRARLNDEAMLGGAAQAEGVSAGALDKLMPGLFPGQTFDTNPPHLWEPLLARTEEGRAFHPVVPFDLVLERIASGQKKYGPHRLRKVLKMAPEEMRAAIMKALAAAG